MIAERERGYAPLDAIRTEEIQNKQVNCPENGIPDINYKHITHKISLKDFMLISKNKDINKQNLK